jgi:hypothetical protein
VVFFTLRPLFPPEQKAGLIQQPVWMLQKSEKNLLTVPEIDHPFSCLRARSPASVLIELPLF